MCLSSVGRGAKWSELFSLSAGGIPFRSMKLTAVDIVGIVNIVGLVGAGLCGLSHAEYIVNGVTLTLHW